MTLCLTIYASRRGGSDADSSVLSNPTDAQNVSCVGLCGRDICLIWAGYFQPRVVNIYMNKYEYHRTNPSKYCLILLSPFKMSIT